VTERKFQTLSSRGFALDNGESWARINTSVVIPIIIRRHVDDASILPLGCDEPLNTNDSLNEFFQKYPEYTFRIESSSSDTEAFEPYRLPEPITSEEGLLPFIKITQVLISGDIPLDQISIIQNDLCKSFLAWCETRWQGLTIKAGRPSIIPLEGEKSGSRIELPFKSVTYLSTQNSSGAELDWFFPKEIVGWSKSCDANVSESVWVRLFNSDLNCCLAYEVNGRISYHNKILKWAMREMTHEGWMKSIFCLIPKWEKWPYENIALPDETAIWPWDGRVLCGWFHWNLLGYPKAPRTVNTQHRFFQAPSEDEEKSRLNSIKQLLESIDIIEFVEPKIARHMVAIIGNDPLSEDDFMIYDTANILSSPETIPSPIAPNSRRFRVTICWTGNTDHQKIKKVFNSIIPEINLSGVCQIITYVDNDFIVADLEFKFDEILIKPSSILINDITLFLTKLLSIFDKRMNYSLKRSTKLYWEKRYNVKLGVEWYDSDKVYMWRRNEQGEIIPVRVTPEELEKD
jgi:hypothetical protein